MPENVSPSLAYRTVAYLVLAQIVAFVLAWTVTLALGLAGVEKFTQSWDELASYRTSKLIIGSLQRDPSGSIRLEPSTELEAELRRVPSLKFAAFRFKEKTPVPGSSPELIENLRDVIEVSSTHAHFVLPGDPESPSLGFMGPKVTPFGRFQIAMYRQKFRWDDLFHSMGEDLLDLAAYFVAACVISGMTAWFAVRQGLSPLRLAARQLALLDMDSVDKKSLPTNVPIEVMPFIVAVNEALTRVNAWASRQRRFTANAAHELRTPLAIMRARLENADDSSLKSELLGQASQLRSIVEQMLMAARLAEGQLTLDQIVDLQETAGAVVSSYLPLAMDCGRFIDFEAETSSGSTTGNRRAIECVITNLIDNAVRAEPNGGMILVSVTGQTVAVVDHGPGIAVADRESIFEPFWRKDDSTPGTGLGLAITKEIMDAHDGRIWLEETPGGGATFKLAFPQIEPQGRAGSTIRSLG